MKPEITLVLILALLINVLGWGGVGHNLSGGVSKSGDSFVYELPAKLPIKIYHFCFNLIPWNPK